MNKELRDYIEEYNYRISVRDGKSTEYLQIFRREEYNENVDRMNYVVDIIHNTLGTIFTTNKIVIKEVDSLLIYQELERQILTNMIVFGLNLTVDFHKNK